MSILILDGSSTLAKKPALRLSFSTDGCRGRTRRRQAFGDLERSGSR